MMFITTINDVKAGNTACLVYVCGILFGIIYQNRTYFTYYPNKIIIKVKHLSLETLNHT